MGHDVFDEFAAGRLSKRCRFRLLIEGEIGAPEIETLIRKLHLDRDVYAGKITPEPTGEVEDASNRGTDGSGEGQQQL
jgi:hypothetical protein